MTNLGLDLHNTRATNTITHQDFFANKKEYHTSDPLKQKYCPILTVFTLAHAQQSFNKLLNVYANKTKKNLQQMVISSLGSNLNTFKTCYLKYTRFMII